MTRQTLWNKNFILLICMNLLAQAAFNLITPLLSLYVLGFGASLATAGLVVGIFALAALLLGPVAGLLIDRMNKKYLLMACTFINGLATFGYMLAPDTAAMIALRMLHGVSFTVAISTNMGWISDFIPKKRLGEGMGYYSIGQVIAMAAAPTAGIEISERIGIESTFFLAALLLIAATTDMSFMKSSPALPHPKFSLSALHLSDIVSFQLLPLSLIGGLFSMGNGLASSFLVLLAQERDIPNIGLYFTVNALCLLLTRPLAGKLYDKKGLSFILYPALLCAILEALLLGHAAGLSMILAAAVIKAFGQGTAQPSLQAECLRRSGSAQRGLAASTFFIGANSGQGFGPLAGGAVASAFGYTAMFNCSAVLLLGGIAAYWLFARQK